MQKIMLNFLYYIMSQNKIGIVPHRMMMIGDDVGLV